MHTVHDIDRLYELHIEPLPVIDRLRLLAVIAQGLAEHPDDATSRRSLLDLEGLGAEAWQGTDAQQYIDRIRDEWESHR